MSKSPSVSGVVSGGEKLRMKHVSCGCDFTVAQENTSAGKIWAWGNNSQAQVCCCLRLTVRERKDVRIHESYSYD